jgi:hypothetical protein
MQATPEQIDQKTINQLAEGSPKALEAVMDCYFAVVYSIGKMRLDSEQLAEVVATKVFAAVWQRQTFANATELKEFIAATYRDEIMKMPKQAFTVVTYSPQE